MVGKLLSTIFRACEKTDSTQVIGFTKHRRLAVASYTCSDVRSFILCQNDYVDPEMCTVVLGFVEQINVWPGKSTNTRQRRQSTSKVPNAAETGAPSDSQQSTVKKES